MPVAAAAQRGDRGVAHDVDDGAADQLVVAGELLDAHVGGERHAGERAPPEPLALGGVGAGEADERLEAAREGVVDVAAQVGGEDDEAGAVLDPLQQVGDLLVGVAVVRRGGGGAGAEERVGLVEEQDPVAVRRLVEDARRGSSRSRRCISRRPSRGRSGRRRARPAGRSAPRSASCRCRAGRRRAPGSRARGCGAGPSRRGCGPRAAIQAAMWSIWSITSGASTRSSQPSRVVSRRAGKSAAWSGFSACPVVRTATWSRGERQRARHRRPALGRAVERGGCRGRGADARARRGRAPPSGRPGRRRR